MTLTANETVEHDGYRRLLADITPPAPSAGTHCRDCGGITLPTIMARASYDGPGGVVWRCAAADRTPLLDRTMTFACGAPNALGRLYVAWLDAQAALDRVRMHLRVLTDDGRQPSATELADLRTDARVACCAELAAEAAYVKAANVARWAVQG